MCNPDDKSLAYTVAPGYRLHRLNKIPDPEPHTNHTLNTQKLINKVPCSHYHVNYCMLINCCIESHHLLLFSPSLSADFGDGDWIGEAGDGNNKVTSKVTVVMISIPNCTMQSFM